MIHVFTQEITPRIQYAFELIFVTILKEMVRFHTQADDFRSAVGIKVNYSDKSDLPGYYFQPSGLLSEKHIQFQYPEFFDWEDTKVCFKDENSFLPFDLFSASFFLVARYEEYLPGKRDKHQRFMSRNSVAAKHGFLELPLVNIWAWKLAEKIEEDHGKKLFQPSSFQYLPSIDVDNAYAFKNKGAIRFLLSLKRDILTGRWKTAQKRCSVVLLGKKDPYDNYLFLRNILAQYSFRPIFFFLLKNKRKYDRSLSCRNKNFQKLIRSLSKDAETGIHPSYASNKNTGSLRHELQMLEKISGKNVEKSRQHYLKLTMPTSYRNLLKMGIKHDYTMGYASRPGFRASIACPYPFFDLLKNKKTELTIHPFQVMDVTLRNYRDMSPRTALEKIQDLMETTAKVGGTFVSLWHNESLGENGRWEGWQEVYIEMTKKAAALRDGKTEIPA